MRLTSLAEFFHLLFSINEEVILAVLQVRDEGTVCQFLFLKLRYYLREEKKNISFVYPMYSHYLPDIHLFSHYSSCGPGHIMNGEFISQIK